MTTELVSQKPIPEINEHPFKDLIIEARGPQPVEEVKTLTGRERLSFGLSLVAFTAITLASPFIYDLAARG